MKASFAFLFLCTMAMLIVGGESNAGLDSCCRKIDEYHDISSKQEKKLLRVFALELNEAGLDGIGYILSYGGTRTCPEEAKGRGERARVYLVSGLSVDAERVVVIDGGYRKEPTVELWIGFRGGLAPAAVPTLEPGQVRMMKRCERVTNRRRA